MNTVVNTDVAIGVSRESSRLLLRPEEGADALGLSRARIFELLADGRIKSIKIGRSRRIPVAELERWVNEELAKQSA